MLDTKFIRENKRIAETGIKAKGFDVDIGALLDLDGRRIVLRKKIETLNTERKNNADIKNAEKGRKLKSQLNAYEAEEKSLNESIELLQRRKRQHCFAGDGRKNKLSIRS